MQFMESIRNAHTCINIQWVFDSTKALVNIYSSIGLLAFKPRFLVMPQPAPDGVYFLELCLVKINEDSLYIQTHRCTCCISNRWRATQPAGPRFTRLVVMAWRSPGVRALHLSLAIKANENSVSLLFFWAYELLYSSTHTQTPYALSLLVLTWFLVETLYSPTEEVEDEITAMHRRQQLCFQRFGL